MTYFSIVWRLSGDVTLLETMIISTWSICTKSAITSNNFKFDVFSALLRLVIWMLNNSINFSLFLLFIETMTCFLDRSFIVMFCFGLDLLLPLMIFWIFSIFFACNFGKVYLILRISLVLEDVNKACMYDFLAFLFSISWLVFLKNLKIVYCSWIFFWFLEFSE